MQYVTQAELDALANAANQVLLPTVNNTIAAHSGNYLCEYDKTVGGIPNNNTLKVVQPQPNYSFHQPVYANLILSSWVYDGSGHYTLPALAVSGDYNFTLGANDTSMSDGTHTYAYTTANTYLLAGTALTLTGTAGQPVTAQLYLSPYNLLNELNRIRADALALILGNPASLVPANLNQALVSSGPWVVGVNDPSTYPVYILNLPGVLTGYLDCNAAGANLNFLTFQNVQFWTTNNSLTVATGLYLLNSYNPATSYSAPEFTISVSGSAATVKMSPQLSTAGQMTVDMNFVITLFSFAGTEPSVPNPSDLGITANRAGTVTIVSTAGNEGYAGQFSGFPPYFLCGFLVTAHLNYAATSGSHDIIFSFTVPTNWQLGYNEGGYSPFGGISSATEQLLEALFSTTTAVSAAVIHPTSAGYYYAPGYTPGSYSIGIPSASVTSNHIVAFISDPTVQGVWTATTLPVPGNHVFIDHDIPPYIGAISTNQSLYGVAIDVGVAGNGDSGNTGPQASTMRQTAPLALANGVNPLSPGISTRPAKWLVRRDTDFMPFDLGFNNFGGTYETASVLNQFLTANGGDYAAANYTVAVPTGATKVVIRLVQTGTVPGWSGGTFSYGTPLAVSLPIYVSKSGFPTLPLGYDFEKTDNTVTIPTDGGAGYLAAVIGTGGFDMLIVNPTSSEVDFDVYIEVDYTTPARTYTPKCAEAFSFIPDQAGNLVQYRGGYPNIAYWSARHKPIPQSGYCIFALRATRLPTSNTAGISIIPQSGSAIAVTIGQNIFDSGANTMTFTPLKNPDSSNLTITIPATAGTSDDVSVFIPVLAGNELVYQCSQQVNLEAWANWQPIWFNEMYASGQYPFDENEVNSRPAPIVNLYALAFVNRFDVTRAGWAFPKGNFVGSSNPIPSVFVEPLFRDLYNDTMNILTNCFGATTGGNASTGAGGTTGSGGAASGAGDDGSSGML